jgi:UDP-glucose 4-epimerase
VQNVIDAVNDAGTVARLLLVSTDKACAPVNVYGMCKAVAERLVTSQVRGGLSQTKYLAVRYGNVLESRGSIIPLFRHQADHADCFTVTDPDMTRFVMTLGESVRLIRHALDHGQSGQTWIPHLPAMRVGDLADLFSERSKKPIKIIGLRPGEKMHEDLVSESESPRTRKDGAHYVIGPPADPGGGARFAYSSSDTVMSKEQMTAVLSGVLALPMDQFVGRNIEEIRRDT